MAPSPLVISIFGQLFPRSSCPTAVESSNVTNSPSIPRTTLGPANIHLRRELEKMYWKGVARELADVILTLKRWQRPDCLEVSLADEADNFIHGYDTFLDQVSHSSRKFADRYNHTLSEDPQKRKSYETALADQSWGILASQQSAAVKQDVRASLDKRVGLPLLKRRARMLLQACAFLDIDKAIEYRDPEEFLTVWKRPAVPQLSMKWSKELNLPMFTPQKCGICKHIIRGCTFSIVEDGVRKDCLCEACYRKTAYGHPNIVKDYKHCILSRTITPELSHVICHCTDVSRINVNGHSIAIFPIDMADKHLNAVGSSSVLRCALVDLGNRVADAKYAGILRKEEKYTPLSVVKRNVDDARERMEKALQKAAKKAKKKGKSPVKITESRKANNKTMIAEFGSSVAITQDNYEEIPFYLLPIADTYPYGNVHMALRIGPLIIENGVENTHGAAVITSRDPPVLQILRDQPPDIRESLLLTGSSERTLYSQKRPRQPKRYKTIMKQVIGGTFCGFLNETLESEIIEYLVSESQQSIEVCLSPTDEESLLSQAVERLMKRMKRYLGPHIGAYLDSITGKLLDPGVELLWNFRTNNCQKFCDQLIDQSLFGPLLSKQQLGGDGEITDSIPLYLMSFVCRPGAYVREDIESKYDVPNGLIEEYLLKFRFGRHEESDIIDSLSEYWYDWGNFNRPLYPYQDVFPWDCTEAYDRYPTKCGSCNIAKHVWAYPFDSWSITALHLTRERQLYPPTDPEKPEQMNDMEWMRNRLTVLVAQDALLTAAAAMAKSERFHESTEWLHNQEDAKLDRLKLGGIHRAQPFSHHFEKGAYHLYFVSQWALLQRDEKIRQYELLRDGRVSKPDVSKTKGFDYPSGGGCGGFPCGGAAGCSGGCGSCGGGCGDCREGGCGDYDPYAHGCGLD